MTTSELKALELAFLFEIDFNLCMSVEDYARTTNDLLLFATLRAAAIEPWRLASLEESDVSSSPHRAEETVDEQQERISIPRRHAHSPTIDCSAPPPPAAAAAATGFEPSSTANLSLAAAGAARAPPGLPGCGSGWAEINLPVSHGADAAGQGPH